MSCNVLDASSRYNWMTCTIVSGVVMDIVIVCALMLCGCMCYILLIRPPYTCTLLWCTCRWSSVNTSISSPLLTVRCKQLLRHVCVTRMGWCVYSSSHTVDIALLHIHHCDGSTMTHSINSTLGSMQSHSHISSSLIASYNFISCSQILVHH